MAQVDQALEDQVFPTPFLKEKVTTKPSDKTCASERSALYSYIFKIELLVTCKKKH